MPSPEDQPGREESAPAWSRTEALHGLFTAGHYEQVLAQGRKVLEEDPEDELAHYYLALSQLSLNRAGEAFPHIDALLTVAPNWSGTHHAAALGFLARRRHRDAMAHVQTALSLDPANATYHSLAAVLSLHLHDLERARACVARARQLDPQDPDILRLAVEIRGLEQTTAREAWERIRELEAALALDPNNPGLHASIGSIHLDELDQPREAEHSFRQALLRNPSDRDHQKALFRAIGRQRLLYRLFSIPARTFAWLGNVGRGLQAQPLRIFFLIVAFNVVLVFFFWLAMVTVLFGPAAWAYQWLLISEIECAAEASDRKLRFKRALNRWPFWVRLIACLGLILGFWLVLFAALGGIAIGFILLGAIAGIHFVIVLALFLIAKARSAFGRRAADRRPRRMTTPPPLPG